MRISKTVFTAAMVAFSAAHASELVVRSESKRANFLELYTSEGCSSCPPAEELLSQLKQSPRLWKDVVPVAFHVDYWNNLGWKDRFSSAQSTARQRSYAAAWGGDSIYTPAFALNGKEWRARSFQEIPAPRTDAGVLTGTLKENGAVLVNYQPAAKTKSRYEAHVAILGFDVISDVNAGENRGRKLRHDFVVLAWEKAPMQDTSDTFAAMMRVTAPADVQGKKAMVVWVSEAGSPVTAQCAGGWLPAE